MKKHNSKCHQDLLKKRKDIRYNAVCSPRNPLEAAAGKSQDRNKQGGFQSRFVE